MRYCAYPMLQTTIDVAVDDLVEAGKSVLVRDWQALDVTDTAFEKTYEVLNYSIHAPIPHTPDGLVVACDPDMPWAENHFLERVGGEPLNPGEQYRNWPHYKSKGGQGVEEHKLQGQFSHTYMERYWPKWGGNDEVDDGIHYPRTKEHSDPREGIRYPYGDLDDVVRLLARSPHTRQAYMPVWFPEDTGVVHRERVPCTLGYHFILRDGELHCTYFIRSCDAVRHFRNDVYMTCRLVQWVLDQVRKKDWDQFQGGESPSGHWSNVTPGNLTMHMTSFHCFEGDLPMLRRKYG